MNERQLAIGESTFGGRLELRSEKGLDRLRHAHSTHAGTSGDGA